MGRFGTAHSFFASTPKPLKHGGKEEAEEIREFLFSYGCRKLILVVQDSFDAISQVNDIEIK
jgi:hypothetical protein